MPAVRSGPTNWSMRRERSSDAGSLDSEEIGDGLLGEADDAGARSEFVMQECGDSGAEVTAEEFLEAALERGNAASEPDGPLAAEGGPQVERFEELGRR